MQANAETTAELLQARWCAVFGPPQLFQTDGGKEFEDVVEKITQLLDFRHEVVPASAKWRQGQVERHGAIVKLMMMRVIHAQQLTGLEQVHLASVAEKDRNVGAPSRAQEVEQREDLDLQQMDQERRQEMGRKMRRL